jgi:hypothetical protein
MKKLPLLLTTLSILLFACNKIDTTKDIFEIIAPPTVTPWDPDYAATVIRKIYVEEFTAHTCTNCPAGATLLHSIMAEDPDVMVTAIHCTGQAAPAKPPFQNDYKTPMGDVLYDNFKIGAIPKAMINRKKNGNDWGFDRNKWRDEIKAIDKTNPSVGIELECTVNESKQEIAARVSITTIKALPNPVQLCLILQQDSIISGQKNNEGTISDYVHNHMLRAGFNGNYGAKLTIDGKLEEHLKYSTSFKIKYGNSFPHSQFPVHINPCMVVAYLLDMETQEVLQVEWVHLQ